jgi:hypothetical protein
MKSCSLLISLFALSIFSSASAGSKAQGATVSFQRAAVALPENLGVPAKLKVVRANPGPQPVTVRYAVVPETASFPGDFEISGNELQFTGRETVKIIPIRIINDTVVETNETFRIVITEVIGDAVIGANPEMLVTIREDDHAGKVNFTSASYVTREGRKAVSVNVLRSGGKAGPLTVDFESLNGSARAWHDFEPVRGTLTFAAGEYRKSIVVPLSGDDATYTGTRDFQMRLFNPTGTLTLGRWSEVNILIKDDDLRPKNVGKLSGTKYWDSYEITISGEDMSSTLQRFGYEYSGNYAVRQYGVFTCNSTGNTYYLDARFTWSGSMLKSVRVTVSGGILNPPTQTITF